VTSATSVHSVGSDVTADSYRGAKSRGRVRYIRGMGARGRRFSSAVLVRRMAIESAFGREIEGETNTRPDVRVARLAAGQHGVVSRSQLFELGFGRGAIEHRLGGLLHPIHRASMPAGTDGSRRTDSS